MSAAQTAARNELRARAIAAQQRKAFALGSRRGRAGAICAPCPFRLPPVAVEYARGLVAGVAGGLRAARRRAAAARLEAAA